MPSTKKHTAESSLKQDLFPSYGANIPVTECPGWSTRHLWAFMKTLRSGSSIGAAVLQKNDYVVALALASVDRVLIVKKPEGCKDGPVLPLFQKLESALFSQGRRVFVLDGDKFALIIHHDLNIRIGNCVDLLSVSGGDRALKWSYVAALGGNGVVNVDAVKRMMSRIRGKQKMEDIALQAWATAYAGQLPSMKTPIQTVERINTHLFESSVRRSSVPVRDES
ncbi:uncharacterized protein SCHCODRAFT_02503975 [Schizophyllum commune H4-8]|uniref:uncharacterized protein n=1 Tax=Schizophyllum commune (strain H4-8 / FGSC 9210) TaxID=578458 RepID=UPI00215F9728|nr:uncharacterized protein SCHCODRAFT_02503975 [Schizophyllum commune H4-8]KAI5892947.1 hypothetical protein SCHCODRAFT_02503975 [Schizophyllum commune H4-8]